MHVINIENRSSDLWYEIYVSLQACKEGCNACKLIDEGVYYATDLLFVRFLLLVYEINHIIYYIIYMVFLMQI